MEEWVHIHDCEQVVHDHSDFIHSSLDKLLQPESYDIECQVEDKGHNPDECRDSCVLSSKDLIYLYAPAPLLALLGLMHSSGAHLADEREAHLGNGGVPVQPALCLHLGYDVEYGLLLVLVKLEPSCYLGVSLNHLVHCKEQRNAAPCGVVHDKERYRVNATVDSASVALLVAEVLLARRLLILCDMHCVVNQLLNTQVLGRRDRNYRDTQHLLHGVYIHRAAVCAKLVHHIKGHNHGHIQLKKLQGKEKVSLYICGIYYVYDSLGLLVQDKVLGYQFLAAVGGH